MKPPSRVRNHLKAARVRLGLSQQELAAAAGVTRQTIGGIEGDLYAPSALVALRLAKALGCRVEDLFWLDDELPAVTATPSAEPELAGDGPFRVTLGRVGERWIAHPLVGDGAFRSEMVPCDGIGRKQRDGSLSVEPLDDLRSLERTVFLAGCTPVLSLWARAAEQWHPGLRVRWHYANSAAAVRHLAAGEVHLGGVHVQGQGEANLRFARRHCPGAALVLVNLGIWDEGLVVGPGNPLGLRRGADLHRSGVRVVNREPGSGARMLLDEILAADQVPPSEVNGYDRTVPNHEMVARAVATGTADAGVTSACVAAAYGLGFVPMREVQYDLALRKTDLDHEPVRQLLASLDHRWTRSQLSVLGGYNVSRTGEIVGLEAGG